MKKYIVFVWALMVLVSCSDNNKVGNVTLEENEEAITTYINGNPQIVKGFKETDGIKTYVYQKEYYEDGNLLKEGPLKEDKRHGIWKSYHRDGSLWSEGEFVDGKMEGNTTSYHPNGQVRYNGSFKDGIKSGEWRFYDEDGELLEIKYFTQPESADTIQ